MIKIGNIPKNTRGALIKIFFKDFNYKNEGDYLYPVEYYQFRQASTHNTFKVELLYFDDRYDFHLTIDNEAIPSKYRLVTSISFEFMKNLDLSLMILVLNTLLYKGQLIWQVQLQRNIVKIQLINNK